MNASEIKALLTEHGMKPNKALGQNFLADDAAVEKILSAAKAEGRRVIEIGPGLGALTHGLVSRAAKITAIEIDAAMVGVLTDTLGDKENFRIVHADFLKCKLPAIVEEMGGMPFDAVGNLPYYITTSIAEKLMCAEAENLTLMVQKEAGERFFAGPGDRVYGPLSVMSAVCYAGREVMELSPASYWPAPEVRSVVLRFEKRADAPAAKPLLSLLRAAFAMRRKTLANNLAALPDMSRARAEEMLLSMGLDKSARAESLRPEQYVELLNLLQEQQ